MKIKYPESSIVSVWVGTFSSENEFDSEVDNSVVPQLGLSVPIASICEINFLEGPVLITQVLEGFSGWESFIEAAGERAKSLGLKGANSALVCYYLKCEDAPDNWGRLTFLGSFAGQDVT